MSSTAWIVIAIVSFALAFIALAAAAVLFFRLKIPTAIGDITGRNVIRGVQALRDQKGASAGQNTASGQPAQPGAEAQRHNRAAMSYAHVSKRLDVAPDSAPVNHGGTPVDSGGADSQMKQHGSTVSLTNYYEQQERGTTVLNREPQPQERGTTVLNREPRPQERGTTVLNREPQSQERGTTVLNRTAPSPDGAPYFNIVKRAVVIHTSETV